jgi:hypothetical protein
VALGYRPLHRPGRRKGVGKSAIFADSIVSSATDIVAAEIDGETVMMSIENGKYYSLDDIASVIWEMIQSPIRIASLIEGLMEKFAVNRENCERDVLKFIDQLNEQKIIQIH